MTWWLEWDDGTGRLIRAGYSTQEEAEAQRAADEEQFPGRGGVVTDTPTPDAPVEQPPVPVEEPPVDAPVEEPAPNPEG